MMVFCGLCGKMLSSNLHIIVTPFCFNGPAECDMTFAQILSYLTLISGETHCFDI